MIFPCIQVCDTDTTIEWYSDFLGYKCTFKSTIKNPEYATLEKGDLKLYLRKALSSDFYASNIVVIETQDLVKEFDLLSNKGVIVVQQISKGMFGTNEFVIKDYEDNKIIYKQSV
jgi:uncharacterized glyoxalase superfamily protein PhnB